MSVIRFFILFSMFIFRRFSSCSSSHSTLFLFLSVCGCGSLIRSFTLSLLTRNSLSVDIRWVVCVRACVYVYSIEAYALLSLLWRIHVVHHTISEYCLFLVCSNCCCIGIGFGRRFILGSIFIEFILVFFSAFESTPFATCSLLCVCVSACTLFSASLCGLVCFRVLQQGTLMVFWACILWFYCCCAHTGTSTVRLLSCFLSLTLRFILLLFFALLFHSEIFQFVLYLLFCVVLSVSVVGVRFVWAFVFVDGWVLAIQPTYGKRERNGKRTVCMCV